ncbi:HAAS domain-containing protein [Peribacillus muralis]|uniref:HAAS domain-containing protein n=1 Tax=Peribacillus muralis TaxID=264697 RepID=UPI0035A2886D
MNTPLSKDSRHFLENLRLYLIANGKNTDEIEEIVEELGVHLLEAEGKDKSVEHIVGSSPKEYMEQISAEMPVDFKGYLKYIVMILFGAASYLVMDRALNGGIEFSFLELIGYPLAGLLSIVVYLISFRYLASHTLSMVRQSVLLFSLGIISIALFASVVILSGIYGTPFVKLENTGNVVALIAAISIFIILSLWSKTWISIIIPILLFGPGLMMDNTDYQESLKLVLSSLITMLGILLYCGITLKKLKRV